jgi:hypothetical protein
MTDSAQPRNSEGTIAEESGVVPELVTRRSVGRPNSMRYRAEPDRVGNPSFLNRQLSNLSNHSSGSRSGIRAEQIQRDASWRTSQESFSEGSMEVDEPVGSEVDSEISSQASAQKAITNKQGELRKNIVLIQSDASLSATDKARKIQVW